MTRNMLRVADTLYAASGAFARGEVDEIDQLRACGLVFASTDDGKSWADVGRVSESRETCDDEDTGNDGLRGAP